MDIKTLRYYSARGMICFGVLWYLLWLQSPNPAHLPPPNDGIYAPKVNSNPKYFLTVNGFIDPKLEGKVPLRIMTTFRTTNPECEYVYNWLEGVNSYRTTVIDAPIPPNAKGNFSYHLPLDYYQPGFCKWQISRVNFVTNHKSLNEFRYYPGKPLLFFEANKKIVLPQKLGFVNLTCSGKDECEYDNFGYNANSPATLNQNYIYTLNLRKKS